MCDVECRQWNVDVVNPGGLRHQFTCFQWWGCMEASGWYWNQSQSVWHCQHATEYSTSGAGECVLYCDLWV